MGRTRTAGCWRFAFLASAWLTCVEDVARADDTHYARPLLGDRPTGMGTAATGLAGDVSAAYYNPAGLTLKRFNVSGGIWLRAFDRTEVDNFVQAEGTTANLSDSFSRGVPGFASASFPFGKRHREGERSFVLAVSSFQLFNTNRSGDLSLQSSRRVDAYDFLYRDQAALSGLTFAARLPRRFSVGISIFVQNRRIREEEQVVSTIYGADTAGPTYENSRLETSASRLKVSSYHFVIRLGVLQQTSPKLSWGVMLQMPGIPIKSQSDTRQLVAVNDATVTPALATNTLTESDGLATYLPVPFELRAGMSYRFSDVVLVAGDFSFIGPTPNRSLLKDPLPFSLQTGGASVFIAASRERRPVANVAVGAELTPGQRWLIRLGFFTDIAATHRLPSVSQTYLPPHVNRFGLSTSLGVRAQRFGEAVAGLSLAFVATFGHGEAMAAVLDDPAAPYQVTTATDRTFYFALTGAFSGGRRKNEDATNSGTPATTSGAPAEATPRTQ